MMKQISQSYPIDDIPFKKIIHLGYDFGQHYSRIRIFEYESYSDVKLLKFNINGPSTLASWSITLSAEGKCANDFGTIHLYANEYFFIQSFFF